MDWFSTYYLLTSIFYVVINAENGHIRTIDAQQDERIRLECTVTSKSDAEEAMWMRIRPPHDPDILTYRDTVVYAPDRIELEQRRLSSNINSNGTLIDTYFITLTILRPNIEDEARYVCSRGKNVFAEYDLFIIVPPQFNDDNSFIQKQTLIEGTTLELSCSANGRPSPSISWFSRTKDRKHISLDNGRSCQEPKCELRIANYSRHGPTVIECVADNEKSPRKSKIFNVDVMYPPTVIANVQTFTGQRSIEVLVQCTSIANPPATVIWLDSNQDEIQNSSIFTIKRQNQSSILSFSAVPQRDSSLVFHCRSTNDMGTDEKTINVSNFIELNSITIPETTTIPLPAVTDDLSPSKKQKTVRPNRARSKVSLAASEIPVGTTTIKPEPKEMPMSSSSSIRIYSFSNNLFYLVLSLFVCCF